MDFNVLTLEKLEIVRDLCNAALTGGTSSLLQDEELISWVEETFLLERKEVFLDDGVYYGFDVSGCLSITK